MKVIESCKRFLEIPDFEERVELVIQCVLMLVGIALAVSGFWHTNVADLAVRLVFGIGLTVLAYYFAQKKLGELLEPWFKGMIGEEDDNAE
ncbi:MAG: hypothetical protein HY432_01940 [Candidatus Liptonbacteria bacterium]|nr:hypothetical protein [Candidatus Liptonbacteria bacterium]